MYNIQDIHITCLPLQIRIKWVFYAHPLLTSVVSWHSRVRSCTARRPTTSEEWTLAPFGFGKVGKMTGSDIDLVNQWIRQWIARTKTTNSRSLLRGGWIHHFPYNLWINAICPDADFWWATGLWGIWWYLTCPFQHFRRYLLEIWWDTLVPWWPCPRENGQSWLGRRVSQGQVYQIS